MRIESNPRTGASAARSPAQRSEGGSTFSIADGATAQRAAPTAQPISTTAIATLLALQSVDDPAIGRRKAVRRGTALLDALDEIKADVLTGALGEGRLNKLVALVTQAREDTDPGLMAVLDDIELRARVELAKRGHYPR